MSRDATDWDADAGVSLWLQRGERVLWRGAPDPSRIFSKEDLLLIPFSLLWGGGAIAIAVSAARHGLVSGDVILVPFVLVGLYMIAGRFVAKHWERRRTRYAITDRRAVVVRSAGRLVSDTPVTAPMKVERGRDGRHGSVAWTLPGATLGRPRAFGIGRVSGVIRPP